MTRMTEGNGKGLFPDGWSRRPLNRILVFGLPILKVWQMQEQGKHVPQVPEKPEQKEAA